jgi:hypothetical protein
MPALPFPLDNQMQRMVLDYLGLSASRRPDLEFLDRLVSAYTQTVPWESVTRITRRAQLSEESKSLLDVYPRWPAEFWRLAIKQGGGGTCYESNYAFFKLLLALGYEAYLTINNMGDSTGCHSAIVVTLVGQKWLVDVGLPLYVPLPLDPTEECGRESAFHRYTVRPDGHSCYQVERDRHPQRNCFTLIDSPVPEDTYRAITAADYGPVGLFLDRVVITKVIDDAIWRFNSGERPYRLERFQDGRKAEFILEEGGGATISPASALAQRFNMPAATIALAMASVR